ncbi:MAG: NAD(P)-dependent oxidoreductase [Sciscionella sp.]
MSKQTSMGVVGLGAMGGPIAGYITDTGFRVLCWDLDPAKLQELVCRGASAAEGVEQLAACDCVLIFVPTDDDVISIGKSLIKEATSATTLVVCSSALPATCRRLAELAGGGDVAVLDAPLTGGTRAADAGEINLLVGGDAEVLARVRDVFDAFTANVHHLGALGNGQVAKTVNNLIHWAIIAMIVESLEFGERLGVAPQDMRAALLDGPTSSRSLAELEHMRLTWWAKDYDNSFLMAKEEHTPLPLGGLVHGLMPTIPLERLRRLIAQS